MPLMECRSAEPECRGLEPRQQPAPGFCGLHASAHMPGGCRLHGDPTASLSLSVCVYVCVCVCVFVQHCSSCKDMSQAWSALTCLEAADCMVSPLPPHPSVEHDSTAAVVSTCLRPGPVDVRACSCSAGKVCSFPQAITDQHLRVRLQTLLKQQQQSTHDSTTWSQSAPGATRAPNLRPVQCARICLTQSPHQHKLCYYNILLQPCLGEGFSHLLGTLQ